MKRRDMLALSSAAAGMAMAGRRAEAEAVGAPGDSHRNTNTANLGCYVVAQTTTGKLRGIDVAGIKQFLGVPYGGSTGEEHRFRPPAKVEPWSGVRDAYGFGPICPQPLTDPKHPFGLLLDWDLQPGAHSEDCLNLNVWTPGLRDGANRPVFVYFHGGGFNTGSANYPYFIGDRLSRYADAVVVTVNHRLGAFGYLDLSALGAPVEFAHAGNVGMLDLVQALQWVRDNIDSFGGDPGSVMIFGQSGGGYKVSTVLAMPAAKGLFHRAAMQSGAGIRATPRDKAEKFAAQLLRQLGLRNADIRKLQQLPFEQIIAAQMTLGCFDYIKSSGPVTVDAPGYRPVVDGAVLPRHPFDPAAPEPSAQVPIMVGYCHHDAAWPLANFDLDESGLKEIVAKLAGADAVERVLDAYLQSYPNASPFLLQALMLTDRHLVRDVVTLADRKVAQRPGSAWVYRFDWASSALGGTFGAVHAMDSALVFRNNHQPLVGGDTPETRSLADKMASAWAAFARSGNPSSAELPNWPAYTAARRETLVINHPYSRAIGDPNRHLRTLWDEIDSASMRSG